MKTAVLLLCTAALALSSGVVIKKSRKFPDDFIFGTGTASYQVEGGWNADDKGENIWDHLTHNHPEAVRDHSNGDVACDTYHNYKRDVEMMRELGLDYYRFSLSWARILPNGIANYVSEAGIQFYNNMIDEMLKYNIQPMISLYHWDLPQRLQDMGGFLNPLMGEWFEDYARVVYKHFGDRVKYFITFNEGYYICYEGYGSVTKAPMLNLTGVGEYICAKNLMIAHARAYHAYNNDFKPTQGHSKNIDRGQCGFTIAISSSVPLNDSEEDKFAVELFSQSQWALYTDPIFSKEGGFPKELLERVAQKSAAQGYIRSRLSDFSEEEKAFIRGTSDFFGVNHYSGTYVSSSLFSSQYPIPSTFDDVEIGQYVPDDWPKSSSAWLQHMPNSIYIMLKTIQQRYGDVPIYITENGWSTPEGVEDDGRVNYYRAALESALDAMEEGVNLKGYFAWSLMDNFEWMRGYTERFGLYEVNFTDPARTRIPRKSAFIYKQIIKSRMIDHDYEPNDYVMKIDEGQ